MKKATDAQKHAIKKMTIDKYPKFSMTAKERNIVKGCIEGEGFLYTFKDYTDFDNIKNEEFHRLRKNFLHSANLLAEYIGLAEGEY